MTLQDLGNIGDLAGAVGVVVALIYLALQVRQNTQRVGENTEILRVSATDETTRTFQAYRRNLIRDPELVDMVLRGYANRNRLPAGEQLRFDLTLHDYLYSLLATKIRCDSLGDLSHWQSATAYLDEFFSNPGARELWRDTRHLFEAYPGFSAEIDRYYQAQGGEEGLPA